MRLTKEQIDFIDESLEELGIGYLDIRYEMLDHIASKLEEQKGYFYENAEEYFITNRLKLIKQYKKSKRQAIARAFKYCWKIFRKPLSLAIFVSAFMAMNFYLKNFVEDYDIMFFTYMVLFVILVPFFWFVRGNKLISVLRRLVQGYGFLCCLYAWLNLGIKRMDNENLSIMLLRYNASVFIALMIILLYSVYNCRKQYLEKYI